MGRINLNRVLLGGILAGFIAEVLGFLVDGMTLGPQWTESLKALGKSDLSASSWIVNIPLQLGEGILSIWLYAAIRPQYGAGARAAIYAGLAVWVSAALLPNTALMLVMGLFPAKLMTVTTLGGILELGGGALAGAALYQKMERT